MKLTWIHITHYYQNSNSNYNSSLNPPSCYALFDLSLSKSITPDSVSLLFLIFFLTDNNAGGFSNYGIFEPWHSKLTKYSSVIQSSCYFLMKLPITCLTVSFFLKYRQCKSFNYTSVDKIKGSSMSQIYSWIELLHNTTCYH